MRDSGLGLAMRAPAPGVGHPLRILGALIVAAAIWAHPAAAAPGDISTVAGNGTFSSNGDGGPATAAGTGSVEGVFFSPGGFHLTEDAGPRVRFVDLGGTISTAAGGGSDDPGDGGPATSALLQDPEQVIRDRSGYVYFTSGNRVRRLSPLGIITTIAGTGTAGFSGDGGPATAAELNRPHGMALDLDGNLYVADCENNRVRRIAPLGLITTVAGTGTVGYAGDGGPATSAALNCPVDVAVDFAGRLVIADDRNEVLRRVGTDGTISTVAGTGVAGYSGDGGPATAALLRQPQGVDIDGDGNLYVADTNNHVIRKIDTAGTISTVVGTGAGAGNLESTFFSGDGGPATAAALNGPREVSFDPATGDLYIADRFNNRVRRVQALGVPIPPPGASINSAPPSPGSDATPTWSFSTSSSEEVRYECRLTRGATTVSDWMACSSPTSYDLSAQADGTYTFSVRAIGLAGAGAPASSSYVFERVDHFDIDAISRQTSGVSFNVTIRAKTTSGATDTSFNGTANLSVNSGSISPTASGSFTAGVLTRSVTVTGPFNAIQTVTATDPGSGSTGTSSPFVLGDRKYYLKQTTANTGAGCGAAYAKRDMEEGYSGQNPEETHSRYTGGAETINFCSPALTSTESLAAGANTVFAYANNTHGSTCVITATLLRNGTTVLSSATRTVSPQTPVTLYTWTLNTDATMLAAGDRLNLRFQMQAVKACSQTDIHYGGTVYRSRLELATGSAAPAIDSGPGTTASDRTPTWSFTGEAGASFTCRLQNGAGQPVPGYDWASCSSPKTFDMTPLPDGAYSFAVRQTVSGVTSSPATSDYALDSTAPAAPAIDTAPPSPSSDTTIAWTFSGEDGAAFECRLRKGAAVLSGYSACAASQGYTLSAGDGTYTFDVRQTDGAGNVSPPATRDYDLDTAAPAAPGVASSPASPGNDTTPTWGLDAEPGAVLECRLERAGTVVSGWTGCTSPRSYDLSSQPDGTYTFLARQTDLAGNTSASATSDYVLDTTPAGTPAIGAGPGPRSNDPTPTWTMSGEAGATFECRMTRASALISDWASCTSPHTHDLTAQADGDYTLAVRQTDAAGNVSGASSRDYALDRSGPGAPVIDSTPPSPSSATAPSWSFSGEAGAAFECRLSSPGGVVSDWSACSSPRAYDLASEPDGSYTFSVRQTDAAGNTSAAADGGYTLDTSAPAAPSIDSAPTSPGSDPTPSWSFSGEAGAALECRLTRGASTLSDWSGCSSPHSFDLTGEPDGIYTLGVRATDAAGNRGAPATDDYEVDRAAPAAPVLTATPGGLGNDGTPTWDFSSDGGSTSECRLELGTAVISDWESCPAPTTYDLSAQPDGQYRFLARSSDAAGNVSQPTGSDYELDRTAPGAPSIDSDPGAAGSSRTPSWAFTGESGAVHECRLSRAGAVVSDWAGCASPVAFDLSGEPDGTFTFEVRGRDGAGNTGSAASSDYRLDTVGSDPTIEAAPGPVGNDSGPSWSFAGEPGARFDCTLERAGATVADWAACTSPHGYDLASEPDGSYTFRVRARDEADNVGDPVSYDYLLDRAAPGAPAFSDSPGELGNDATPRWAFSAEPGAVVECSLVREGQAGPWAACAGERSYDLATSGDGAYALTTRATDAAGNTGPSAESAYQLDTTAPDAPSITDDPGERGRTQSVSWAFTGEPAATFECHLSRGDTVLSGWESCAGRAGYTLSAGRAGEHDFRVRARDRAGNTGVAARSVYELLAPAEEETPPPDREPRDEDESTPTSPPAADPEGAPAPPAPSEGAPATGSSSPPADSEPDRPPRAAPTPDPRGSREPDRDGGIALGDGVTPPADMAPKATPESGQSLGARLFDGAKAAAVWVGRNLDKTGFPMLLLLLVLGYTTIQNRLDGRDPKLALAPVHADRDLEFLPPGRLGPYARATGHMNPIP